MGVLKKLNIFKKSKKSSSLVEAFVCEDGEADGMPEEDQEEEMRPPAERVTEACLNAEPASPCTEPAVVQRAVVPTPLRDVAAMEACPAEQQTTDAPCAFSAATPVSSVSYRSRAPTPLDIEDTVSERPRPRRPERAATSESIVERPAEDPNDCSIEAVEEPRRTSAPTQPADGPEAAAGEAEEEEEDEDGKSLGPRAPSPERARRSNPFEDSGLMPKAKARPPRLVRKSRDPNFGSGLAVKGRRFKAAPTPAVSLPGALPEEDADEFLMDGILEETGAVFAGTAIFKDVRDQYMATTGSGGFRPAGMERGFGSTAGSVGLSGTAQYLQHLQALEEEHSRLEEELMGLGLDDAEGDDGLDEQLALLDSLQQQQIQQQLQQQLQQPRQQKQRYRRNLDIDPDDEVAMLLESLQQGSMSLSLASMGSVGVC